MWEVMPPARDEACPPPGQVPAAPGIDRVEELRRLENWRFDDRRPFTAAGAAVRSVRVKERRLTTEPDELGYLRIGSPA